MRIVFLRTASLLALGLLPPMFGACSSGDWQATGSMVGPLPGSVARPTGTKTKLAAGETRAVVGGIAANDIGQKMNPRERDVAANAEYRALEYGRSDAAVAWSYPATHHRGAIVPGKPYQQGSQYCRNYIHTVYWDGAPHATSGTACRSDDGTWRIVS